MNNLQGSWQLVSWEILYPGDEKKVFPFGENPKGILMYSADGYMSANISRAGRRPLSTDSLRKAPSSEKLTAFETNFSYAGPYRIEGNKVIHTVEYSLNPNMVATKQIRDMAFEGDHLILSADEPLGASGQSRHHQLIWKKI